MATKASAPGISHVSPIDPRRDQHQHQQPQPQPGTATEPATARVSQGAFHATTDTPDQEPEPQVRGIDVLVQSTEERHLLSTSLAFPKAGRWPNANAAPAPRYTATPLPGMVQLVIPPWTLALNTPPPP